MVGGRNAGGGSAFHQCHRQIDADPVAGQYQTRLRSRDFEMTYYYWAQSLSPGNEQKFMFGSASANDQASQNYTGLADSLRQQF